MRIIDRWIGVPACFALSAFESVRAAVAPHRTQTPEAPRNVLIIQLSEMGSLALAYPAVRELCQTWPEARLHFLVFARNRSFLELLNTDSNGGRVFQPAVAAAITGESDPANVNPPTAPLVLPEDVWTLDDTSLGAFVRSTRQFVKLSRARRIDTVLDYELFSRASMILSYLSGAGRRAGFHNYRAEGLYRGELLTHPVHYNVYKHIAVNFAAMVRALVADPREQPCLKQVVEPDLSLPKRATPPERAAAMRERIQRLCPPSMTPLTGLTTNDSPLSPQPPTPNPRLVVLSPFSGNLLPIRAWPPEHYVAFIRGLFERTEDTIALVVGLPEAREYCRPIFEQVQSPRLIDFIGQTKDIADLIDLFNVCDLFVTTDSGPPHFAAMTGIPTIAMFGPECPMLYGPLGDNVECVYLGMSCSPCVSAFNHRNTPCRINRCMIEIEPERILEMALKKLEMKDRG